MKRIVLTLLLLIVGSIACAQSYYHKKQPLEKNFSYQVGASVMSYNNHTMYGYFMGVNFKERLELGYFHVRDYVSKETFMDTRWGGFYAGLMFPLNECITVGAVVRRTRHDLVRQQTYLGAEFRFSLSESVKLAVEYGKGEAVGTGVKLIWNLY